MNEDVGGRWRRIAATVALAVATIAVVSFAHAAPPTAAELAGAWAGTMTHDGDTQPIAFSVLPDTGGKLAVKFTIPVMHLVDQPFGSIFPVVTADSVKLGSFRFRWDEGAKTLTCNLPHWLVPLYDIPATFHRVDRYDAPPREPLDAPIAKPLWEVATGSALWAGPVFDRGTVYAGAQDGRVIALDAATGAKRWEFLTGGAIRCRPVPAKGAVVVQADDGFLYSIGAARGTLRWKTKVVDGPVVRLPFSDPRSRYDRFGSDVTVLDDRLYLGTHDGKLLALAAADGKVLWEFKAADAILAAPLLVKGTLYAGSYDKNVYAVDAASGALRWKHDCGGAVVSTPAFHDGRVIVGTRAYDLLALDAASGDVKWKNYVWMSWIESSPVVSQGVVYVGSSDAAAVFAVDAETGRRRWTSDVFGWSWGRPAVDARHVYASTSSQVGYLVGHAGGLLALDRATGKPAWRYAASAPDTGAFGFPGSPVLGAGRVYVSGLDGRILAFKP